MAQERRKPNIKENTNEEHIKTSHTTVLTNVTEDKENASFIHVFTTFLTDRINT